MAAGVVARSTQAFPGTLHTQRRRMVRPRSEASCLLRRRWAVCPLPLRGPRLTLEHSDPTTGPSRLRGRFPHDGYLSDLHTLETSVRRRLSRSHQIIGDDASSRPCPRSTKPVCSSQGMQQTGSALPHRTPPQDSPSRPDADARVPRRDARSSSSPLPFRPRQPSIPARPPLPRSRPNPGPDHGPSRSLVFPQTLLLRSHAPHDRRGLVGYAHGLRTRSSSRSRRSTDLAPAVGSRGGGGP